MPLITGLEIDNFRCFEKLRVDGLTRVNLFVGKNNSGKTALLEAVEAVVSVDNPLLLYRASVDRGESRIGRAAGGEDSLQLDIRHWFYGHSLDEGASFSLRATGEREFSVSRGIERAQHDLFPRALSLTIKRPGSRARLPSLTLTADGFLGAGSPSELDERLDLNLKPPVGFVATRRLLPAELALLWKGVVLTPREEATVKALRLVEPAVERIAISGSGEAAAAQVLLHGASSPVPLGTLGEGVSRILALALHLVRTQGGFLLIDEIENGLHWSVMSKVWRFLVESARSLDVQIFLTTHSKDCLEAIADLHRTHPQLAAEISVHRLERGRETPVRFDASRIAEYVNMELETR
jgi:predicted ATPase